MVGSVPFASFLTQYGMLLWWSAFLFGILMYGIFSAILVYHWRTYAIGPTVIRRTLYWYFASTGTLLLIATGSLLWATL